MKLCDLNTAKALQELGYDGEYNYCHVGVYPKNEYQIMALSECEKYRHDISILCAAPRLDDAAYWLRDKHKISFEPICFSMAHEWRLAVYDMDCKGVDELCVVYGKDYDTVLETAVKKAIEIIKNRKQKIMDAKGRYRKELAKAIKKMKSTNPKSNKLKTNDRRTTAQA